MSMLRNLWNCLSHALDVSCCVAAHSCVCKHVCMWGPAWVSRVLDVSCCVAGHSCVCLVFPKQLAALWESMGVLLYHWLTDIFVGSLTCCLGRHWTCIHTYIHSMYSMCCISDSCFLCSAPWRVVDLLCEAAVHLCMCVHSVVVYWLYKHVFVCTYV